MTNVVRRDGTRGALTVAGVSKSFGDVVALDDVSLDVKPGEFVTLLGPSGSGKTTTLRIIAGFTHNDDGVVNLDGRDLAGIPSYKRDIGMVFQNYALFPHMTAASNVAFPLRMRRFGRQDIRSRVTDVLRLVHLDDLGDRYPRQLSGGQQQRVALARAIVFSPRLLLMDEPLGALDRKLRDALQLEIVQLSQQLGISIVYVTHDQEEALVMSDRIAVYDGGQIRQVGTPAELYETPSSRFVASFVGESNIFSGVLRRTSDAAVLEHEAGPIALEESALERVDLAGSGRAAVVVRPERVEVSPGEQQDQDARADDGFVATGCVEQVIYLGAAVKYVIGLTTGTKVVARLRASEPSASLVAGATVMVRWQRQAGVLVPDEADGQGRAVEATHDVSVGVRAAE